MTAGRESSIRSTWRRATSPATRTLGAIASVQPYHAIDDGKWAEKRIGSERAKTTYAFRSFADHRVRLAFGSDWPVAPLDPMQGDLRGRDPRDPRRKAARRLGARSRR